jgi:hypothetical protein
LVPNSVYGYADLNNNQVFVSTDDLLDRGDWSSALSYAVNNAALYLGAYYICLTANTNTPPDGNTSTEWSTLVLVRQGQDPNEYIVNGTRVIREYHIAWGTNASNNEVSASDVPYSGSYASVQSAIDALFTSQDGSNFAYALYLAGTNYTNSQVQIEALNRSIADLSEAASRIQGDGTIAAYGSQYATILRDQGTNYTDAQIAIEVINRIAGDSVVAQQGSNFAYDLYVAGTNYTNNQVQTQISQSGSQIAQSGSQFSVILRDQGTNYTNSQVQIEAAARTAGDSLVAQNGSQFSVILHDDGTNYTNSQVLIEAAARAAADLQVEQHGSELAYVLYWQGTAASGAAIELSDAGVPNDGAGLATARVGNNLPIKRIKAGTNIAVENNGTNVKIGIDTFDTTDSTFRGPSVGEAGTTAYSGTVFMDFGSQAYSTVNLAGNLFIIPTGMQPGRGVSARLIGDSVARDLGFAGGVRFIGTRPTSLAANKIAVVSFSSYSTDIDNVVGAYSAEQ